MAATAELAKADIARPLRGVFRRDPTVTVNTPDAKERPMTLTGKTAIVTGGNSGTGKASPGL